MPVPASRAPITGITQVSYSGSTDYQPDVAASNGSIVITWAHHYSSERRITTSGAERFVISGGVPIAQGIFGVNVDTNFEYGPERGDVAGRPVRHCLRATVQRR